jgi:hypothetical protein
MVARVMKVDDGQGVLIGPMSIAKRVKAPSGQRRGTLRVERGTAGQKAALLSQKRLKMSMSAQTQ